jgi:hypothetical protein
LFVRQQERRQVFVIAVLKKQKLRLAVDAIHSIPRNSDAPCKTGTPALVSTIFALAVRSARPRLPWSTREDGDLILKGQHQIRQAAAE